MVDSVWCSCCVVLLVFSASFLFFFFFKQKTAYEMRISDWSSDVCSSDLFKALVLGARGRRGRKILPVNAATAPAELTGSAQNEIEETRRTARIKMGIGTGRCQDGVHIEALLLWPIVEMTMRLFGEMRGRNPVEERSEEHTSELQSL